MTYANRPVVAGVDGTSDGIAAAEYAAEVAVNAEEPLMLLHAYRRSPAINPLLPVGDPISAGRGTAAVSYRPYAATYNAELMRNAGATCLDAAHRHLAQLFPHLTIHEKLVAGSAAKALIKMSRTASVVVVARNHERSVERFFAGSTSSAVAAHAACPTVVVPTNWHDLPQSGRIVVGLDAARDENAVISYAFQQASRNRSELLALHAWPGSHLNDEARLLSEALAGWSERYPEVSVQSRVVAASPTKALIEASDSADLVVVGARGQGGLRLLTLGSTARAVVAHSTCPAVVVRHSRQEKGKS